MTGGDEVARYLETFEALRLRKRWTQDSKILRFAALALGTVESSDPHADLERTAETLRRGAGWFGPLRSEARYLVAAMLLRQRLDAARAHAEVRRVRAQMRRRRLPRAGLASTLAALLMVLRRDGETVPTSWLDRLERIMQRWKSDHFWLTGVDDLPAAALHASSDAPEERATVEVERAYRRLHSAGFRRGNPLQLVAQLLAIDPRGVDEMTMRFERVAKRLAEGGVRVGPGRYDEAALLALTSAAPGEVVRAALDARERLRAARPRPAADLAFSLAAGLALSRDSEGAARSGASDLAHLRAVQAILAAQQAALVAAMAASSAAASASSG